MTKRVIGLTGGIASGKSQVSNYFKALGIDVIDADQIARDLFKPNSPHLAKLREHFGDAIFNSDNTLDRKALGQIVFADAEQLAWLNQLTHPLVAKQTQNELRESSSPYVILDIPLLVKKDGTIPDYLTNILDRVLVVEVDPATQLARVIARDDISEQQAKRIIAAQASPGQRRQHADDVLENNHSLDWLQQRVIELHQNYLENNFD